MSNKKEPLVSVVVASYNSEKTIVETLESIKTQTYRNIELIITDDFSTDGTTDVCREWLCINKLFFTNTSLILSEKNTGISPNMNRGVRMSSGSWVKILAADDKLLPNCISSNINFVLNNPQYDIVFSKIIGFGDEVAAKKCEWKDCNRLFNEMSEMEFRVILYQRNFLPAASVFYKKNTFDELGGYDVSIPYMEDWPFWIKALDNGCKLGFNDDYTVEYRFSPLSISQHTAANRNPKFVESSNLATNYAYSHLKNFGLFSKFYYLTTYNNLPYNSLSWKFFHSLNIINPFYYYNKRTMKRFKELLAD